MAEVHVAPFGALHGRTVHCTTLENSSGLSLDVLDYGAILRRLLVPSRTGKVDDVVLGFDDLGGYLECDTFFGAIVGRVANRIENANFELEGRSYSLHPSDPPHHLHGGDNGWVKVLWQSKPEPSRTEARVRLTYVSPDGEEGYPGQVTGTVLYALTDSNQLRIEMEAEADATTPVSMAHHSYWNLAGHAEGTVEGHELQVFADEYTPGDPVVPDGRIESVDHTPFDFRQGRRLQALDEVNGDPPGYDHNFVVRGPQGEVRPVACLIEPESGRRLELSADQPGVQVYTGNFLDGHLTGKGVTYGRHAGICLETQAFPNAINVPQWRDQVLLRPGQRYRHVMVHQFEW